jgi:hypothetical protein
MEFDGATTRVGRRGINPTPRIRGDAPMTAPVLQSVRRPGSPPTECAVYFIVKEAAERAGVNPAASIHWLRHAHASHAIDNGAPIAWYPRWHQT